MRLFKRVKGEDHEVEITPDRVYKEKEWLSEWYHDVEALMVDGSR